MSFPIDQYKAILEEASGIVQDRCAKGRNEVVPFYERFIHGHADQIFMVNNRVTRIRGAEAVKDFATMRQDAIDLVNEAAFLVMLLDRQAKPPTQ